MSPKITNLSVAVCLYIMGLPSAFAQGLPPPGNQSTPAAPINSDLYVLMAAGILLAIYIFHKETDSDTMKKYLQSLKNKFIKLTKYDEL